ncbi:peptidase M24 family protein [Loigolactobacillus backii]|uniref:M24 family metallopeptidase n=1 Tax=Loigolactobacillus backii TaxID=375175 RepID=UPI000C1C934D|nr:Xaa-Pro peptidase family protein [Loigolactobacillus backii]PIO83268.1 peptidase M24 family protein [Loigolactobacillus backii]
MASRVERLREKLAEIGLDGLLVTSQANLRYLSAFTGTTGVALITRTAAYFITDSRYLIQAQQQVAPRGFVITENKGSIYDMVNQLLLDCQLTTLGFEEAYISFQTYDELADLFDVGLVPVAGMIEELREVKEPAELELIEKAIKIADQGYQHILATIRPGMTERQVANELDFYMRKLGASGTSFETIVASGVRSALPHGVATDKIIQQHELITVDFGCYYHGYVSDVTRTFAIGRPDTQLQEIYKIVLEAQRAVVDQLQPGVTGATIDAAARDRITKAGYGPEFGHDTGHGIGLEIHEGPYAGPKVQQQFIVGNVETVEPGIYLPGLGGVRIEDDLLVTPTGNQVLNQAPKHELIVL